MVWICRSDVACSERLPKAQKCVNIKRPCRKRCCKTFCVGTGCNLFTYTANERSSFWCCQFIYLCICLLFGSKSASQLHLFQASRLMCKKITVFWDATTCHPADKTHHLETLKLLAQKIRFSKQKHYTTYEVSFLSVSLTKHWLVSFHQSWYYSESHWNSSRLCGHISCFIWGGVESIATKAANSPIVLASDDRRLNVELWYMITGRKNRRRHKCVPVLLHSPQIPRGLNVCVSSSEPCLKTSTAQCLLIAITRFRCNIFAKVFQGASISLVWFVSFLINFLNALYM